MDSFPHTPPWKAGVWRRWRERRRRGSQLSQVQRLRKASPSGRFKQLFAHFTAFLETYVHSSALAEAIIQAGAAQQPYAPEDTL